MELNRPLRILIATAGLVTMAGAMLGPIAALFVEKIGGDLLDASLAGAVWGLVSGVSLLLMGRLDDQIRHHETLIGLGYLIQGIGYLGYYWVGSVWSLLVVQVVVGLGYAVGAPAWDVAYSRHLEQHKGGVQWGWAEGVNQVVLGVGAILGGAIVTAAGFEVLFIVMAIICLAVAGYIFRLSSWVL